MEFLTESQLTASLKSDAQSRVYGTNLSSQAWLLAQCIKNNPETSLLVTCPTHSLAMQMVENFKSFTKSLGVSTPILLWPTWDHAPHRGIRPSVKVRNGRIHCLQKLRECRASNKPVAIIASIQSQLQATMPESVFNEQCIDLEVEADIDSREKFIRRLNQAGYQLMDPTEDRGTYAIRGEIIDIFPAGASNPYRIELYDTLIERIRAYDPETQRTIPKSEQQKLSIPPAREFLIMETNQAQICTNIKEHADDWEIQRRHRDPLIESVRFGSYPDISDYWVPFAFEPQTIENHLPGQTLHVAIDEWDIQKNVDSLIEDFESLKDSLLQGQTVIPDLHQTFVGLNDIEKNILKKSQLVFDSLRISQSETADSQTAKIPSGSEQVKILGAGEYKSSNKSLKEDISKLIEQGFQILAFAPTKSMSDRLKFLIGDQSNKSVQYFEGSLSHGFKWPEKKLLILSATEVFGKHDRRITHSRDSEARYKDETWSGLSDLKDLQENDKVIHIEHGLGIYQGIKRIRHGGRADDFVQISYANDDRLYVPVYRIDQIQKYVGGSESASLDKLGGQSFEKTKKKVKESIKTLAFDLVDLYAKRKIKMGQQLSPPDSGYRDFEDQFLFSETPDQITTIERVNEDLISGKVMDRVVCGDVGFGKTEVAMRAAYQAVFNGMQVAVLVPTTVLSLQHLETFSQRFKNLPVNIKMLSRFVGAKTQKETLKELESGEVDIVIGTHRLLSKDIKFKNLGLVVVDEEHRFGVEHKEKLKALKINTHVLTLTATPIPRTLQMSLSGIRDISLITTAPVNRLPIRTYIATYEEEVIKRAIEFELDRGGQAFFVHNRVQSIYKEADKIQKLVPRAKIQVAHGQMTEKELEKAILAFFKGEKNILVCTTIIESGIDIPSANTMIINRADTFGLAQLYQIRGRVGRSENRAYCYLLIPPSGKMTNDAKRRLEVIQNFVELGSGFQIATHDLEIRGGGNFLGPQQSGNIAAVGFELFTQLLDEAVAEIQGKPIKEEKTLSPEIKTPYSAYLDESYVSNLKHRLSFYRKLSGSKTTEEIDQIEMEMIDRFGKPPNEAMNLFWLIRIKLLMATKNVRGINASRDKCAIQFSENLDEKTVQALLQKVNHEREKYKLTPDSRLIVKLMSTSMKELYFELENSLEDI